MSITALGYYDSNGDGLVNSHPVAIYDDSTHNQLVSATIASGTTDSLNQGFRVVAVSFTLAPGKYDILGFTPSGGGADNFLGKVSSATPVTGLTFVTAVGAETGSLQFTNTGQSPENIGIFGPNFFVVSTVPEPSSFLPAVIGCACLGLAGWKRRRAV